MRAQATNPGDEQQRCSRTSKVLCRPYSVLLPVGFAVPPLLPGARCALAAPFHRGAAEALGRSRTPSALCGTFPDPSCEKPPGVTRHRRYAEPGLSSRILRCPRSPDPLASGVLASCSAPVERVEKWRCPWAAATRSTCTALAPTTFHVALPAMVVSSRSAFGCNDALLLYYTAHIAKIKARCLAEHRCTPVEVKRYAGFNPSLQNRSEMKKEAGHAIYGMVTRSVLNL
jgi:hypothetical protein